MGFQSESASSFKWSDDLQSKYDVFGHVEPGDFVTAEHQPVLFDGKIEKKGLVRKIRERN